MSRNSRAPERHTRGPHQGSDCAGHGSHTTCRTDLIGLADSTTSASSPANVVALARARRRRAVQDALDWLDHHNACACWTAAPPRRCARTGRWWRG